jgi:hypothetical protein
VRGVTDNCDVAERVNTPGRGWHPRRRNTKCRIRCFLERPTDGRLKAIRDRGYEAHFEGEATVHVIGSEHAVATHTLILIDLIFTKVGYADPRRTWWTS